MMESLNKQSLEEEKKAYKHKVHVELMRRGVQYEELLTVMSKTRFYETLAEKPEEQLLRSVEDTVDEILLTAARFNPRDGRNVDIKPLNNDSREVIGTLLNIEKRPSLYFNEDYGFNLLNAILFGMSVNREGTQWINIYFQVLKKFDANAAKTEDGCSAPYCEWNMTDREMFDLWFKCFHEVVDPLLEGDHL